MRVETGPQVPGLIILVSDFCHLVLNLILWIFFPLSTVPVENGQLLISEALSLSSWPSAFPWKDDSKPFSVPPWKDGLQPLWFPLEGWLHLLQCSPWKDGSNFLSTPGRVSSNPLETIAFYRCSQIENSSANTTPPPLK